MRPRVLKRSTPTIEPSPSSGRAARCAGQGRLTPSREVLLRGPPAERTADARPRTPTLRRTRLRRPEGRARERRAVRGNFRRARARADSCRNRGNARVQARRSLCGLPADLAVLGSIVSRRLAAPGRSPGEIDAAVRAQVPAAVFAVEGGDFIENRLDRIHEAYRDGVRAITIVHYHVNQIGDIQTSAPVHGGLTRGYRCASILHGLGV